MLLPGVQNLHNFKTITEEIICYYLTTKSSVFLLTMENITPTNIQLMFLPHRLSRMLPWQGWYYETTSAGQDCSVGRQMSQMFLQPTDASESGTEITTPPE